MVTGVAEVVPAPVHERWYVVVVVSGPVDVEPLVALPVAKSGLVQEVAPEEDQVRVDAPPDETVSGLPENETVGAPGGGGMQEASEGAGALQVLLQSIVPEFVRLPQELDTEQPLPYPPGTGAGAGAEHESSH
jgi:hypothetical protein